MNKSRMGWIALLSFGLVLFLNMGLAEEIRAETVLRVAISTGDAGQLDPYLRSKTQDTALLQWMFNSLVRFKPGSMDPATIEPDLAEKWTSSPDGKVWTFHLRKGVKFHRDFGELTAEDVAFSLNRARNTNPNS